MPSPRKPTIRITPGHAAALSRPQHSRTTESSPWPYLIGGTVVVAGLAYWLTRPRTAADSGFRPTAPVPPLRPAASRPAAGSPPVPQLPEGSVRPTQNGTVTAPMMASGASNPVIATMQHQLSALNTNGRPVRPGMTDFQSLAIDGTWGPATARAVSGFASTALGASEWTTTLEGARNAAAYAALPAGAREYLALVANLLNSYFNNNLSTMQAAADNAAPFAANDPQNYNGA